MTAKFGDIGALIEVVLVKGADFGPIGIRFPDGFDLTGCVVTGGVKKMAADPGYLKPYLIDASQQADRVISFRLPGADTATLTTGQHVNDVAGLHHTTIDLTDAAGRKRRLFYGPVRVAP